MTVLTVRCQVDTDRGRPYRTVSEVHEDVLQHEREVLFALLRDGIAWGLDRAGAVATGEIKYRVVRPGPMLGDHEVIEEGAL